MEELANDYQDRCDKEKVVLAAALVLHAHEALK